MSEITWNDFERVELRVGTVIEVQDFPEARQPAYIVTVDFGDEFGVKKTSARVTDLYKSPSETSPSGSVLSGSGCEALTSPRRSPATACRPSGLSHGTRTERPWNGDSRPALKKEELVGRQVIGVTNFPPKQIGPVRSEFLLTGFYREDGAVVLAVPDGEVPNGSRLA